MIIGQDKGKNAYDDQRYDDARTYYQDILLERKNDNAAKFGLGATAYKQKDIETALSALNDAKNSEDPKLASKAYYNLGNMLREQNKIDDGLAFYKKAIELDPNDQDAKINFELLKQIVQQQKQEQQEQNQQNQEQQEQEQQEQNQQNQEQQDQKESDEQKTDQQIQAEAILNALKDQEKINQKRQIKTARSRKMEKDW